MFFEVRTPHEENFSQKKIFAFFLSALLVLALSLPVFADMGPKPSVTLKLYYTPGQRYAVTLLGNTASTAPGTAPADYRERMGSREAWEAFRNYPAPEGYYFLGYFQEYPAMPMQSSSGATTRPTSSMFCSII